MFLGHNILRDKVDDAGSLWDLFNRVLDMIRIDR